MKKYLLTLALLLIVSSIHAQKKSIRSIDDFKKQAKAHRKADRSTAKTTAIYWRLSAYALYDNQGNNLSDSGRYYYSNARGSRFDYEYMEFDDYGVDGEFNTIDADTCFKFSDDGSGFGLNEKYTSTYNSANLRIFFSDQTGPQLPNYYRELGTYDANGNLTVEGTQDWNSSTNQWDDSYVSFYTYDGNNNLISDSSYDHDWGQPDVKGVFTYDANGNLQSLSYDEWDGSMWVGSYAAQYQYDINNRQVIAIYQNYDNGMWIDYSKDSTTYTGSNTIFTTRTYLLWDTMAKQWVNNFKEERTFNSNGQPITALLSTWDSNNNKWIVSIETEYSYNANGDISEAREYPYIGGTKATNFDRKIIYYYEVYFDVSVKNTDVTKAISVYPNPATSGINILLNGQTDVHLSLVNMTGQTVRSIHVTDNTQKASINTEGLATGNYILHVKSEGNTLSTQKVIIQ